MWLFIVLMLVLAVVLVIYGIRMLNNDTLHFWRIYGIFLVFAGGLLLIDAFVTGVAAFVIL